MGWQIGFIGGRDVGYGVPCQCEYPACKKRIDRGLSYACGGFPGETEFGCAGFFCDKHMSSYEDEYGEWHQACDVCVHNHELPEDAPASEFRKHYPEKPDLPVWMRWKLRDKSWAEWRDRHPEEVKSIEDQLLKLKERRHASP